MTIKQFAALCSCNTQTLRYYDKIGLLKPARVDPWSGYRYYDREQGMDFVKIKNLQAADFSIEEIRLLLNQSDRQVYEAFNRKIQQQEAKLAKIREIQQAYLTEKNSMETLIQGISDFLLRYLTDFEGLREFGLEPSDSDTILAHVRGYLNRWMVDPKLKEQEVSLMVNDEIIRGADRVAQKIESFREENLADTIILGGDSVSEKDAFDPAQFETIWECSGWAHVYDFLPDIPGLEQGREYCLYFLLDEEKYAMDLSFPIFMLGAMIVKKDAAGICMGCSVEKSSNKQNSFRLMRKKA